MASRFAALPPGTKLKVLSFGAQWCPACRQLKGRKVIYDLGKKYPELISVEEIDVDKDEARADAYRIKGMPTVVIEDESGHELTRKPATGWKMDQAEAALALATRKWKPKKAGAKEDDEEVIEPSIRGGNDDEDDDDEVDEDE